jgi:succinate dehydrogenase / fumarate reductase, cytochrome b subunit
MKWSDFFTSSVGKKFVMALTGLFLISFLVIHAGINACIFNDLVDHNDNGDMFNRAANFMGSSYVIRLLEVGLFGGFIVHIVQGYTLEARNLSRRGQGYKISLGNRGSKWYSRAMGLLGTLLLLFLIMHISNFWVPSRITGLPEAGGKNYHDLFGRMVDVFSGHPFVVGLYILGCVSLSYHLMHGFQSAFRTLGLQNHRYIKIVSAAGTTYSLFIPFVFAMMPVSIYFGWIN